MEEVQKFEKQEYRFYVRVRTFLGETAKAIHQDLVAYGGPDFVAYSTIAKWRKDFSEGRMDIEDKPRSGRPRTQITEDNINLIERLIEADPHSTYADLALDSQLSHGTIERIIQDHLQKKKVAARWVPHKLTLDQKQKRVEFCPKNLEKLESEQWRKYDIVTCDETWIYLRHIGRKQEYEVWVNKGQSPNTVPRRGNFE